MRAKDLLELYLLEKEVTRVSDTEDCRRWLENELDKVMPRKLFVSRGIGGGQDYKIMFSVVDPLGNFNRPCYFYSEMPKATAYLKKLGHIELQSWIDSSENGR